MSVPTVTHAELRDQLRGSDSPLLLDVRSPAEFESAHLPGSVNVPLDEVKRQRSGGLPQARRPVVTVCGSGGRATQAAEALRDAGVGEVSVLDGGLSRWREQGGDVEQGRQVWEMERQVRLVAGSIVLGSILTSTVRPGAKWVAGGIGTGLTFAALSNTCAMGTVLSKMPWNQRGGATADLGDALRG